MKVKKSSPPVSTDANHAAKSLLLLAASVLATTSASAQVFNDNFNTEAALSGTDINQGIPGIRQTGQVTGDWFNASANNNQPARTTESVGLSDSAPFSGTTGDGSGNYLEANSEVRAVGAISSGRARSVSFAPQVVNSTWSMSGKARLNETGFAGNFANAGDPPNSNFGNARILFGVSDLPGTNPQARGIIAEISTTDLTDWNFIFKTESIALPGFDFGTEFEFALDIVDNGTAASSAVASITYNGDTITSSTLSHTFVNDSVRTVLGGSSLLIDASGNDFTNTVNLNGQFDGISVIPEPASFTLIGSCLALGLVMIRRRRS